MPLGIKPGTRVSQKLDHMALQSGRPSPRQKNGADDRGAFGSMGSSSNLPILWFG
jgi:hypothetical protein